MTVGQTGSGHGGESGEQWLTTFAALLVGGAFFALWFWLLPGLARLPSGNERQVVLAMAGGHSVGARIRGGPALHLGFRMDGTRYPRAHGSAAAIGRGGVLPLREKPDVRGLRSWVDRALGGLRTRQPSGNRRRSCRRPGSASVCGLL